MNKTKIIAYKAFGGAPVTVKLTSEGLSMDVGINDFLRAMSSEVTRRLAADAVRNVGNPALVLTNAQLLARVTDSINADEVFESMVAAASGVLEDLKKASVVAE